MSEKKQIEPLPDIYDYLDTSGNGADIALDGLDDLIAKVKASTGLNSESAEILVKTLFQEIRNEMLKGNIVHIDNIGNLFIACPKNKKSPLVYTRFKPNKKLFNKIKNGK